MEFSDPLLPMYTLSIAAPTVMILSAPVGIRISKSITNYIMKRLIENRDNSLRSDLGRYQI